MWMAMLAAFAFAAPSKVEVAKVGDGWRLLVDGKPFVVKGAGGDASKQVLKDVGGNAFRTWGADNLDKQLDEAHKLGLKVAVGIWLGHKEHGFRYDDPKQVAEQFETVKAVIQKYKNHPAVLLWSLGNEMEGFGEGDDPNVWLAIEDLAHMAKKLDPNHPTMTVLAEIGGKRVQMIHQMCPSIDIVGINSYGGAASIPERYAKEGGKKPYIVTEFGPPGDWESPKTPWLRPIELTSTQKVPWYERAYKANVLDNSKLCLGAFAFLWGNKQEGTSTWFGMFLPDGTRLGAVDAMQRLWTGKAPAHPCPRIESIEVVGDAAVDPSETVSVKLKASDPGGGALKAAWHLTPDNGVPAETGGKKDVPNAIAGAVLSGDASGAKVKMPATPGPYRLYVFIRNAHGGGATANVPLRVRGPVPVELGAKASLPFALYTDSGDPMPYAPAGWMGNAGAMKLDPACKTSPHSGTSCLRWDYEDGDGWGGIAWQSPQGDWGDKPGGFDLTGAKKLVLWARGASGGEVVSFGVGLIKSDKKYFDTAIVEPVKATLKSGWQKVEIPLAGKDLKRIKTGLVMTVAGQGKPLTVFLDDIAFE